MRLPDFAHSLRVKLATAFVVVVTATALAMGVFVDRRSRGEILRVHADHGSMAARSLARACAHDVAEHDAGALLHHLEQLATEAEVRYAAVFDANGAVLATWHQANVSIPAATLAHDSRAGSCCGGAPHDLEVDGEALTEFDAPIRSSATNAAQAAGGRQLKIGCARLGITRHALMQRLEHARTQTVWLVVIAVLLGTLVALVALRSVLHPVRRLIRATRALARGSVREIAELPRSRDELGLLSRSFRTMAWRLAESQSQLVESNAQLEQRVHARTAELERALADLRTLDRMKDDFLSNVSHEFKTPLTNIRLAAEVLRDYDDGNEDVRRSFLGQTIVETERLTRLVNNLIDLVKVESNDVRWHLSRVDPLTLAEDVSCTLAPLVRDRQVRIVVQRRGETPPVVTDPDRVRQVLANLLLNAITFSCSGGSIEVWMRHDGRVVQVFVRDHGVGIDAESQIRIFERFKQAGDTLTDKPPGAGLGLPLSKGIVEHLGGEMAVASRRGCGSTFVFSLPIEGPTPSDLAGTQRRPVVILDERAIGRE